MISHRHWLVVAALALTTGCAATRSGMGGAVTMGGMAPSGMAQSGMAHDSAAMPSLASMIQRTDSLLQRTARMIGDTNTATPRAMAMEHLAGDLSHTMAGHLQAMAIGLRGLLQQMAAMHRPGMQMDVDAESAMMDLHRRSNVILGEMEKAVQALDGLPKRDARGHP